MSAFRTIAVFFDALASYRADRRWRTYRTDQAVALIDAWRELPAAVAPVLGSRVWQALVSLQDAARYAPGLGGVHVDRAIEEAQIAVADAIDDACSAAVLVPEVSYDAITIPPPPPVPRDTVPSESESGDGEVAA